jgi:hypothetical protein
VFVERSRSTSIPRFYRHTFVGKRILVPRREAIDRIPSITENSLPFRTRNPGNAKTYPHHYHDRRVAVFPCLFVCVAASNKYRVFWSPSEFLAYECWAVTVNSTVPVFTIRQARCHGRMPILCSNGTRLYREFVHAALGNEGQFHLAQRGRLTTPSGGEQQKQQISNDR